MFSLAVLIGRGLDHLLIPFIFLPASLLLSSFLCIGLLCEALHAPLAQLVEHLTLNQGVPGSSP